MNYEREVKINLLFELIGSDEFDKYTYEELRDVEFDIDKKISDAKKRWYEKFGYEYKHES